MQRERLALYGTEDGRGSSDGEGAPCEPADKGTGARPVRATAEQEGGGPPQTQLEGKRRGSHRRRGGGQGF